MKKMVLLPDPRLMAPCEPVVEFGEELHSFLNEMKDAMYAAQGVGLAANQLGDNRRIFVMDAGQTTGKSQYYEVINPVVITAEGPISSNEGCLSVPGYRGNVPRFSQVHFKYQDRTGEEREAIAVEFEATVVQHEMDHLDGKLYIHKLGRQQRRFIERQFSK